MAILHVRGIPDELYEQLQLIAKTHQRSLSAQVIAFLDSAVAVELRQQRQAELLNTIRYERVSPPTGTPDTVLLLREDRER